LQAAGCALSWCYPVAVLRGAWVGYGLPYFWLAPCFAPQFCAEFHVKVSLIDINNK